MVRLFLSRFQNFMTVPFGSVGIITFFRRGFLCCGCRVGFGLPYFSSLLICFVSTANTLDLSYSLIGFQLHLGLSRMSSGSGKYFSTLVRVHHLRSNTSVFVILSIFHLSFWVTTYHLRLYLHRFLPCSGDHGSGLASQTLSTSRIQGS